MESIFDATAQINTEITNMQTISTDVVHRLNGIKEAIKNADEFAQEGTELYRSLNG